MNAQTNTEQNHEGGKERTAAARSTSWAFRVGDRVSWEHGTGVIEEIFANGTPWSKVPFAKVSTGSGNYRYPNLDWLTLVEDAPAAVVAAVNDCPPLLLEDEPLGLGCVDACDQMTAAAVDACSLIVRICESDGLTLKERVRINGVTWLVDVRPE